MLSSHESASGLMVHLFGNNLTTQHTTKSPNFLLQTESAVKFPADLGAAAKR